MTDSGVRAPPELERGRLMTETGARAAAVGAVPPPMTSSSAKWLCCWSAVVVRVSYRSALACLSAKKQAAVEGHPSASRGCCEWSEAATV